MEVKPPDVLRDMERDTFYVVICTAQKESIEKQLASMGITDYHYYRPVPIEDSVLKEEQKPYRIGYVPGAFDLFHVGHLNMFKRAKEQCDYLIVGVVTDEGVRKFKETDTFVPYEERAEMVRSCRYVDEVAEIPLNFGGTSDAWRLHHFDCQFSGSDYVDNPDWLAEKEFLEKHGAEMVFFPYTESTSSTKLKAMIERKLL